MVPPLKNELERWDRACKKLEAANEGKQRYDSVGNCGRPPPDEPEWYEEEDERGKCATKDKVMFPTKRVSAGDDTHTEHLERVHGGCHDKWIEPRCGVRTKPKGNNGENYQREDAKHPEVNSSLTLCLRHVCFSFTNARFSRADRYFLPREEEICICTFEYTPCYSESVKQWNKHFLLSVGALVAMSLGLFFTPGLFSPQYNEQDPINPLSLTGEFALDQQAVFHGETFQVPTENMVAQTPKEDTNVLGVSDSEKRIEVDLTNQRVYAYEGDTKVYDFLVSTGKWGRTPTGEFRIWGKFRATKMSGGSKELRTYYYLPNVPYVMFFSNDEIAASRGFSLHGTYWHSNFGTPMSHGCINMKTEEAGELYYWATPEVGDKKMIRATDENPGTRVIIYGEAPQS